MGAGIIACGTSRLGFGLPALLAIRCVPGFVAAVSQELVDFGKLAVGKFGKLRIVGLFDKGQLILT